MGICRKKFLKFVGMWTQRKYLVLPCMIAILFNLTVTAHAAEKPIPGDAKVENEFSKRSVEKEFHLYVTDGYQEMANGESIYFWGFTHAKDFADVGEIKTREERDAKLLPPKMPGDEIRLTSGKNYVVVLHNAGWYETEAHSGINHVSHTIHWHGLDLIPAVDGVPNLPIDPVAEGKTYRYTLSIPKNIEGTYLAHCHVDSTNHIMAGLYFPLILEKKLNRIYGYKFDREYTLFFSEADSEYMEMLRTEGNIRHVLDWKSNYFMLNGRIFTDNLENPLSTINDPKTRLVAYEGETILVRLIAIGYDHIYSWHPHGYHGLVVGTDGRKLRKPYEKDTLLIGSGERYDILYKIPDFSSQRKCPSCNLGAGITIAHDHNLMGMVSRGIYPHGALTIFDVRPKPKSEPVVLKQTMQKIAQVFKR